jgi:hypothetical protein
MVTAYAAMTKHMPDNGLQVAMFTHQDAGVWADLGAILWASGLRVTAAWNIVTETESALKEGNYVQGTICLALRKRLAESNARRMEIEAEIEDAVREKLDCLTALDDSWHEKSHAEILYTDGDVTLAAYAAALQVVTSYSAIDRQPLDRDLDRKRPYFASVLILSGTGVSQCWRRSYGARSSPTAECAFGVLWSIHATARHGCSGLLHWWTEKRSTMLFFTVTTRIRRHEASLPS